MKTYELWLTHGNGKHRLRFPVLPSELRRDRSSANESHRVARLGEVTVIQDPNLKTFTFSSFFPKEYAPYCDYRTFPEPIAFVNFIEQFRRSGNPSRFIYNDEINTAVTIESFNHYEKGGEVGDIHFDIILKEYPFIKIRNTSDKPTPRPSTNENIAPSKNKIKKHTVKSGETLWAIAVKYYKSGSEWRKIWNVKENKDMLVKRDKRNLTKQGQYIYVGQSLVIP